MKNGSFLFEITFLHFLKTQQRQILHLHPFNISFKWFKKKTFLVSGHIEQWNYQQNYYVSWSVTTYGDMGKMGWKYFQIIVFSLVLSSMSKWAFCLIVSNKRTRQRWNEFFWNINRPIFLLVSFNCFKRENNFHKIFAKIKYLAS